MKNNLTALNNYLFEQIERLSDDDMTEDQFETEIKRSRAVTTVANAIIQNGKLSLDVLKYAGETDKSGDSDFPPMLESK